MSGRVARKPTRTVPADDVLDIVEQVWRWGIAKARRSRYFESNRSAIEAAWKFVASAIAEARA